VITVFCLVMIHSTIAPLMSILGTIFFFFKYFVDKYNMLYVYPLEYESNGMTVNTLIRYSIIGIVLFNVILIAYIVRYSFNYLFGGRFLFSSSIRSIMLCSIKYHLVTHSLLLSCLSFSNRTKGMEVT
jgi:hypothetical protein